MITQAELKHCVNYDPLSGVFTRCATGNVIGTRTKEGSYKQVRINGKSYLQHRLAYLYMTGSMPCRVDHIDIDKHNNAWSNLREADASTNGMNCKVSKNNHRGTKNVSWNPSANGWDISVINRGTRLRAYRSSLLEAVAVAFGFRNKLHGAYVNHG